MPEKTTLVNLLMRFFEPTGGTITIDGVDTKDMTREDVHRKFGMVLQDTWLFEAVCVRIFYIIMKMYPKKR